MQQEVVLAMLAKEPSQGYELRARLDRALGPLGEAMNAGQIYVTLGRLEKAGLVARDEARRVGSSRPQGLRPHRSRRGARRRVARRGELAETRPRRVPPEAHRRGRRRARRPDRHRRHAAP